MLPVIGTLSIMFKMITLDFEATNKLDFNTGFWLNVWQLAAHWVHSAHSSHFALYKDRHFFWKFKVEVKIF